MKTITGWYVALVAIGAVFIVVLAFLALKAQEPALWQIVIASAGAIVPLIVSALNGTQATQQTKLLRAKLENAKADTVPPPPDTKP